jgi:ankyrin repeat protein
VGIVEFLAKHVPGSMNEKNNARNTSAHVAAVHGNLGAMAFLAEGVPGSLIIKNNKGETPLDLAREGAPAEVIVELEILENAATEQAQNSSKALRARTPLPAPIFSNLTSQTAHR